MKNRTKIVISTLMAGSIGLAWSLVVLPYQRIHQVRHQFALVERGDTDDAVRQKIKSARLAASALSAPYWNETQLGEEVKQTIRLSVEARVDTFFLPITAVISFDASGRVVGKHIYD